MKMTIYDIAEELKVSPATVSLALNGDRRVAEKTRLRITEFAARRGFTRNEQARNFRLRRTNNVAIVVHNIDNDFWFGVVRAVENGLGESYNVILCNTEGDLEKERKIFRNLMQRKIDGIIVQPASAEESHFVESIEAGIPVVSLEETDHELISFVKGHDFQSAYNLTGECIRQGHRRIAFLTFRFDCIGLAERVRGFRAAAEEAGIEKNCEVITAEDLSFEAVDKVFSGREYDFTLVLGSDDRIACRLLRVLAARKIRVPEQVSVVGWNDSRFLEYLTPPLASVSIPLAKIGQKAAEIILANLNDGPTVVKAYVQEEIILRESFAPVRPVRSGRENRLPER